MVTLQGVVGEPGPAGLPGTPGERVSSLGIYKITRIVCIVYIDSFLT